MQEGDAVGAFDLARGGEDGLGDALGSDAAVFGERLVQVIADEVGENLGVRLGQETMSMPLEAVPEGGVVLDDAIMHHRNLAGLVEVRMRVDVAGQAVRGPAGVAAQRPADRFRLERLRQSLDAPDLFAQLEHPVGQGADACGVVAAIFQPAEALNEQRFCFLFANVSNNATHDI